MLSNKEIYEQLRDEYQEYKKKQQLEFINKIESSKLDYKHKLELLELCFDEECLMYFDKHSNKIEEGLNDILNQLIDNNINKWGLDNSDETFINIWETLTHDWYIKNNNDLIENLIEILNKLYHQYSGIELPIDDFEMKEEYKQSLLRYLYEYGINNKYVTFKYK